MSIWDTQQFDKNPALSEWCGGQDPPRQSLRAALLC